MNFLLPLHLRRPNGWILNGNFQLEDEVVPHLQRFPRQR